MNRDTAVLIIFFNRPSTLKLVFEEIKKAKPERLYLAQDGARCNNISDTENMQECRKIVENIDWNCKVYKNYSSVNKGCGEWPYSAINWVFQYEEKAIILEDDCVPSQSFFTFCCEMLEKYKEDNRIFLITGCNFELDSSTYCPDSYFYGYSSTNWGWATWKRNWNYMDYNCEWTANNYLHLCMNSKLEKYFGKSKGRYNMKIFSTTYKRLLQGENLSFWDVQWQAVKYFNCQVAIIPSKNLITNIGLGFDSTHAKRIKVPLRLHNVVGKINFFYNQRFELEFPLNHPRYIIENSMYDKKVNKKLNPNILIKLLIKTGGYNG